MGRQQISKFYHDAFENGATFDAPVHHKSLIMAKKKTLKKLPFPEPPGGWVRWCIGGKRDLGRMFARNVIDHRFREWRDLQKRDANLQVYDPDLFANNARTFRDGQVKPKFKKLGLINDENERVVPPGTQTDSYIDELVEFLVGKFLFSLLLVFLVTV